MSLSNILEGPNTYDLFCRSINQSRPFPASKVSSAFYFLQNPQAINNAFLTPVLWEAASPPRPGIATFPFTYSGGIFTCTAQCQVTLSVQIRWADNTTGNRSVGVFKNNDVYIQAHTIITATALHSTAVENTMSTSWNTVLDVGDTFQIKVEQDSAGPLNILGQLTSGVYFTLINITTVF